jgi:hypothetical protein
MRSRFSQSSGAQMSGRVDFFELMKSAGSEPVEGKHFTYQTTPAGAWEAPFTASCWR